MAVVAALKAKAIQPGGKTWWQSLAEVHAHFCPHGNWFFLPWHRAYVYFFERLGATIAGDPTFAVPYWDWSSDPDLPDEFRDHSSPLYLPGPNAFAGGGRVNTRLVGPYASKTSKDVLAHVMAQGDFISFGSGRRKSPRPADPAQPDDVLGGVFEDGPHSAVHQAIGGTTGFMGGMLSPADPIFWLHHANCDRIWAEWMRKMGPAASLPPPPSTPGEAELTSEYWLDQEMGDFYVDPTSPQQTGRLKIKDMLASEDPSGLGYTYDTLRMVPAPIIGTIAVQLGPPTRVALDTFDTTFDAVNNRLLVSFKGPKDADSDFQRFIGIIKDFISGASHTFGARLELTGLHFDPAQNLSFLGSLGSGREALLSADTSPSSPYYLGDYSVFAVHSHAGHALPSMGKAFDFSLLVKNLVKMHLIDNSFDGTINVAICLTERCDEATALAAAENLGLALEFRD